MGQFQLLAAGDGDGGAEYTTGIFQHEVYLLRGDGLGGDNQVALILAVFIVDHDDKFAFAEVGNCLFYRVEFNLVHKLIKSYVV